MIGFIDALSFLFVVLAFLMLLFSRSANLSKQLKITVLVFFAILIFHYISNALEWLNISSALDPYEDFIELFEPVFLFFIFYIYLAEKSNKALSNSEEKYRLLIENQTDLVVKVDSEGNFLYVSSSYCETFGKSESDLIGKKFIPLVHEDDREPTLNEMEKLKSPPHSCYIEQRAMTAKGWRWFGWADKAVTDENGKILFIIA